jgi:hypothetical protein
MGICAFLATLTYRKLVWNRQSGLLFIMTGIQTPESTPMEFSWSNALKELSAVLPRTGPSESRVILLVVCVSSLVLRTERR